LNRRPDGDPNADKTQGGHGAKSGYDTEDGAPPSATVEPFAVDLNLEHALGGMLGSGDKVYRPITRASDKWHTRKDVRGKYLAYDWRDYTFGLRLQHGSGRERYANIVAKTGGKVGVMRRKLERAIQAKQRREWDGSKEYGRLDSKRLVAAVTGVPTVFKERREAPALNTAISMLIDLSGSMSGPKVQLAEQAAICLCEALDKTGIAYEVLGFCNRSGHVDKMVEKFVNDESNADHEYSRWSPLDMYVFKDYGERLREAHTAMGAISSCSGGDNSDSEALLYAYARLASRPEPKKIMLVLSDGFPASWCSYGTKHLYQHLRNVVADIAKSGTHIIGIGINSDAVKQFYPKYVVLEDLDDLSKNVLDQIGKMILGDRYMADNGDLIAVTSM
jgi:cobalamin biosynthesis protein CobT